MKRSPLVKKDAAHLVGYGRQLIHVLEESTDSPQNAFVGDFLTWRGSEGIYRRDSSGSWIMVHPQSSVYLEVVARLYEEGINLRAGDDS